MDPKPARTRRPLRRDVTRTPPRRRRRPPARPRRRAPTAGPLSLIVGSIGVVYGDIGTSPLYALRESLAHAQSRRPRPRTWSSASISLLIWALIFTVTLKYVVLPDARRQPRRGRHAVADGARAECARPARRRRCSCSASPARRCSTATPSSRRRSRCCRRSRASSSSTRRFGEYVLPITVVILVVAVLGAEPRHGAGRGLVRPDHGRLLRRDRRARRHAYRRRAAGPARLQSAHAASAFCCSHGWIGFAVLGSVFLVVTGAEALYADMGHFGRAPIQHRLDLLRAAGAAAQLSRPGRADPRQPEAIENPFFLLAPEWALLPLVILATLATVIASQAVITGAFSLARQAIQLGLLPRLEIPHTSETQEGQIYIGRVNRLLLIGVLMLVFTVQELERAGLGLWHRRHRHDGDDDRARLRRRLAKWRWPLWRGHAVDPRPFSPSISPSSPPIS